MMASGLTAAFCGVAAAGADDAVRNFSDILDDVGSYSRAIAVARACGMAPSRADRAVSMVMVYAYAAARPRFSGEDGKRMFLVQVVEQVSRKHEVGMPSKVVCTRSYNVIDQLPRRLDAAVRTPG